MYDVTKIYSVEDFESLSSAQLMELFKDAKSATLNLHDMKRIKKVVADLSLMQQTIKGFNQNHNRKEQLQ